jgi:hypothetical protein
MNSSSRAIRALPVWVWANPQGQGCHQKKKRKTNLGFC